MAHGGFAAAISIQIIMLEIEQLSEGCFHRLHLLDGKLPHPPDQFAAIQAGQSLHIDC